VIVCEHRVEDGENSLLLSLPEDAPAMFLAVRLSSYLEMMRNQGCRYVPIVTELSDMNTLGYLHYWPDEREFTNPLLAEVNELIFKMRRVRGERKREQLRMFI